MDQSQELARIKGIIQRRRAWLVLPFVIVVVGVTTVALLLPDIYQSTATILIQNPTIPDKLAAPTITGYADQRIKAIAQEATSRSKVLALVQKYDLLPQKRERLTAEELVEEINKRISVETIDAEVKKDTQAKPVLLTVAFTLSFEDESARKAQMVANEIASYFMQKNLEAREKHARTTAKFFEEQLQQTRARIDTLESRLAAYRQEHLEELPEFTALNMQKLEKLNADTSNINLQLRSLEEHRALIKSQLATADPYSGANPRVLSTDERLQQAELERAALAARYSEKHPLVQAKNQEIDLLEGKATDSGSLTQKRDRLKRLELELVDLSGRYSDEHPAVKRKRQEVEQIKRDLEEAPAKSKTPAQKPTNPAFVTLKADLDKCEVSIASLVSENERLEEQLKTVYDKLHAMPQVAKEYNELTTDYQNARNHYNELQQKALSAQLAQGIEEEQLGESFQIIEPAFLPEKPDKPNRLAIILIAVVLGMGLSVGLAALRELTDNTLRDADTLEQLTGMPLFSIIPRIVTAEDRNRMHRKRILTVSGTVAGVVILVVLFHFLVMDISVFNARLERFLYRKFPL